MLHEYKVSSVRINVTYDNIICPNLFYILNMMLVPVLILHTKMYNGRNRVAHENIMSRVRKYVTTKCVMFEHMFHTNMRLYYVRINVTYENVQCPNIYYIRI